MEMPLLTEKPDRGFLETPNATDLLEEAVAWLTTCREEHFISTPLAREEEEVAPRACIGE